MEHTDTHQQQFPQAVRRRVMIAAILGAGLVFLDSNLVNVALPAIQRDLSVTTTEQQWVASAFLLTLSALLLVGGRLADVFGRKRLFVSGLAAYALFAVAAVLAPSGGVLIAARGLQGVAGAMMVPTTLAMINAVFPAKERGKAIGTWAAWSGIATLFGPIAGGLVIDVVSWRFALLITPLMCLLTLVFARGVPETRDLTADRRLDVPGVVLVAVALGALIYGLIEAPIRGWGSPWIAGSLAAGVVLLAVFAWWESRARVPVMPYAMFANRDLALANVVTFFVYAGLYGMSFYVAIYSQSALGASATIAAGMFVPVTVTLFVLSPIAGRLNDRYGPRWLLFAGPMVAAAGIAISAQAGAGQLWTVLVPGIVVFGIGLGFTVAPVTATAIGAAEERFSGVASGFNNAVSRVAGLIAIALMGILVVQFWQSGLAQAGVEAADPEVARAVQSVAEQAFVTPSAEGLDAATAEEAGRITAQAAQSAFRSGMLLAAALVAVGGLVSAVGIRGGRKS